MRKVDPNEVNAATKPEFRYDTRDISFMGLAPHIVGFFIFATVTIAIVWVIYLFAPRWAYPDGGITRGRTEKALIPPDPNPLLQDGHTAKLDIFQLRRAEAMAQESYGWEDRAKGVATIPIDRAIELTAERGLEPAAVDVEAQGGER